MKMRKIYILTLCLVFSILIIYIAFIIYRNVYFDKLYSNLNEQYPDIEITVSKNENKQYLLEWKVNHSKWEYVDESFQFMDNILLPELIELHPIVEKCSKQPFLYFGINEKEKIFVLYQYSNYPLYIKVNLPDAKVKNIKHSTRSHSINFYELSFYMDTGESIANR